MTHSTTLIILAAAAVGMSTSTLADETAIVLEPTWKVGKTYVCEHKQEVTISIGTGEQTIENPVNVALTFEASVAAHGTEGEKAISFKTTSVKMMMNMFGTKAEYDSDDESKQSEELAGMIAGIVNTDDLKLIFDRNDVFVRFEGGESAALKESTVGTASLAPMRFGKNEVRQLLTYCVRAFPKRPIKKGDTWKEEIDVNLNVGAAAMKMTMTSEGNDQDARPVITYASEFDVDFPEGGLATGGSGVGKMTGRMTYDPKEAIVRAHVANIEMTVSMNGLEMPIKQQSTTRVVKIQE